MYEASAFDLSAAKPLKVKLAGLSADTNVTLAVSSGSVAGTAAAGNTGRQPFLLQPLGRTTLQLLDDGTYSITLTATDSAGNTAVPRSGRTAADAARR